MVNLASVTLHVRGEDDQIVDADLFSASKVLFESAVPWRQFRWYRGQRHYSGSYWCATTSSLVGYESRLELANLLCADFEPQTSWILAQPLMIAGNDGRRLRRHVPDYLVEHADGSVRIIDVKPARLLTDPRIRAVLDWSRAIVESRGWQYEVQSEPDAVRLANLTFLAGYRREFQFQPVEVEATLMAITQDVTIGAAIQLATAVTHDRQVARAVILHLLWRGLLSADLSRPLQRAAIVERTA